MDNCDQKLAGTERWKQKFLFIFNPCREKAKGKTTTTMLRRKRYSIMQKGALFFH